MTEGSQPISMNVRFYFFVCRTHKEMAQKQKLAAEIDRVVRKVTEGISLFDDIWEKLHNASATNLKERLQADLKSETKKLQRMREQIKTWQGMSDIRDKRQIDEARRNIEAKMEQFKACEREAKIKTFSKIGLSLPAKEDPEEMAKEANRQWMNSAIDNLQQQREQCEADIEGGNSRRAKRGKGRGGDVEAGKERIVQYRFHIAKLEQLLRMLDNDQVSAQDVEALQEPITHFVDCNQDSSYDSIELEGIYLDVIPDDMDDPDTPTQPTIDKKDEPLTKKEAKEREREKRKAGKKEAAEQAEKVSTPTTPSIVTPPSAPLTKPAVVAAAATTTTAPTTATNTTASKETPKQQPVAATFAANAKVCHNFDEVLFLFYSTEKLGMISQQNNNKTGKTVSKSNECICGIVTNSCRGGSEEGTG